MWDPRRNECPGTGVRATFIFSIVSCVTQPLCSASYRPAMQFRSEFNHCCVVIGRASAIIMFAGMGSLILVATLADVLR